MQDVGVNKCSDMKGHPYHQADLDAVAGTIPFSYTIMQQILAAPGNPGASRRCCSTPATGVGQHCQGLSLAAALRLVTFAVHH